MQLLPHIFLANHQNEVDFFQLITSHLSHWIGEKYPKKPRHEEGLHVGGSIAPLGQGVANTSSQQHLLDRDPTP